MLIRVIRAKKIIRVQEKSGQSGQGQNGQNRFRKRGHYSLYINILIFIL